MNPTNKQTTNEPVAPPDVTGVSPTVTPTQPYMQNYPINEPATDDNNRSALKSKLKGVAGTVALLVAAPLLALFLTAHVFQPYEVDGISMDTTLQSGDRLIVFKLPKTIANITNKAFTPNRLDIVVFDRPSQLNAPEDTEHLIKRVIGLPGERVVISDGAVTVYNKEVPDGFNPDAGQEYSAGFSATTGKVDITVGRNEIFVLGDNRNNSSDSRVFGAISSGIVVGRATARFIPINGMKQL